MRCPGAIATQATMTCHVIGERTQQCTVVDATQGGGKAHAWTVDIVSFVQVCAWSKPFRKESLLTLVHVVWEMHLATWKHQRIVWYA